MDSTHVFDLFDGEVRVGWDTYGLWSDVYDNHDWSGDESFQQVVDLLVRGS